MYYVYLLFSSEKLARLREKRLKYNGFTLIELLVVVSIMVILTSAMVINLNGQRAARDVKIAQNELVSNLRKIQSYTLSARLSAGGQYVQYYFIKFDLNKPNQYTLQALYNASSAPALQDIETIYLPKNIRLSAGSNNCSGSGIQSAFCLSRPVNPATQIPNSCALAAFAAPFGRVFLNDGCTPTASNPYQIDKTNQSDDYSKFLNFVSNTACLSSPPSPYSPSVCSLSTDSSMTITLTSADNKVSKTVTINGITGSIIFN